MLGLGGLGRHGGWAGGWAGGVGPAGGVLTEGGGGESLGGPWVLAAGRRESRDGGLGGRARGGENWRGRSVSV